MADSTRFTLSAVLDGLAFPAQRWQILTQADMYGADAATLDRLLRLPRRQRAYRDLRDVMSTLDMMS